MDILEIVGGVLLWDIIVRLSIIMNANLVNWRANPKTIRVSIRKVSSEWQATITCLISKKYVSSIAYDPKYAIMDVLNLACIENYYGLDLSMQGIYQHPWK